MVYDLPADSLTGKRRQKSQTVKGTKRDAERALREILLSIEKGVYVKRSKLSLGELLRCCGSRSLAASSPSFVFAFAA